MRKRHPLSAFIGGVLLLALLFCIGGASAWAIAPNTPITNTVTATFDVGGFSYSTTASDTVVTDAGSGNSAPSGVSVDPPAVDENLDGVLIGLLTAADSDPGDSHTFIVADPRFEVVGDELRLVAGLSLDFETNPSVTVAVTATDALGASVTRDLTITVNDINEAPTDIVLASPTFTADVPGAVVGALSVVDPDAGDSHSYAVDDVRFEVVAGQLKMVDAASLPLGTSVTVQITATDAGGLSYSESFTVTAAPPGSGADNDSAVSFLQFAPAANGAASVDVAATQCDSGGGYQNLPGVSGYDGIPVPVPGTVELLPASVFKSGSAIFMQVTDLDANTDPASIESVQVTVATDAGDTEQLRLFETAVNAGIFVGYAQSSSAAASAGDCVINTLNTITVTYIDAMDAADTSVANVLVDPVGVVFYSGSGQPISGTRITLVDAASGLPAPVFGDDGSAAFPSTIISGAGVVDGAGVSYDFADGAYRFPFVASGDYVLVVDPPNRFVFPSAVADPTLQLLPGAPFALGPGSRGNLFSVPVGPAVRVDIPLDVAPIVPTVSAIELLSLSPGNPNAALETVPATTCFANGAFVPAAPPTDQAGVVVAVPASLELAPASRFGSGDAVYVRLTDLDQDLDPFAPDLVTLDVSVPGQVDVERVQLEETAASTGVFVGYLQTSSASAVPNDCRLGATPGSSVEFSYVDAIDSGDRAQAEALIDPGFLVFSSLTGAPVDGVEVTLVDAATGLPATSTVFGADGITPFPATVTSGGSVTDQAGTTIDFAPGSFRFPVVRPGSYRLEVVAPAGIAFPSVVNDGQLVNLPGGPYVLVGGSRGNDFDVLAGIAPAFDVPVDPSSAELFLSKQVSKESAGIGDFVQYQVLVQNSATSSAVTDLIVSDVLPKGFRFVAGSARAGGLETGDPVIRPDGRSLTFEVASLAAGAQLELRYVTEITVGTELGRARNEVTAGGAGVANANVAFADVTVREDLLGDKAIVVGRVVDGSCETAEQSPGLANVRIFLEDGTYVVTDAEGKYHFEGVAAGSHVVQLDVGSLPLSHEVVRCDVSSRFAGSGYSQFVDVRGGTLWRADFYVAKKPDKVTEFSGRLFGEAADGTIRYRYEVAGGALDVRDITSVVMLPDALAYVAGSSAFDGRPAADPRGAEVGALQFKLPDPGAEGFVTVIEFSATVLDPRNEIVVKALTMLKSPTGKHQTPVAVNEMSVHWPVSLVTIAETRTHFAEAESQLPPDEVAKLAAIRAQLARSDSSDLRVRVVGHADSKPLKAVTRAQYANNQALSEARAANVAEMVRKQLQLPEDRVIVEARGSEDPLADNATDDGRAANRRVDIAVVGEVFEPSRGTHRTDSGIARLAIATDQALADAPPYEIPEVDDGAAPAFDHVWLNGESVDNAMVWPREDYNPRIPSITVAVKHEIHLQPQVMVDGNLVNPMTFEGATADRSRGLAVSVWDNVSVREGNTEVTVHFMDDTGVSVGSESRNVHFAGAPIRAELVRERSYLVADGITPPVVAVRLFDREGYPARPGLTGEFSMGGNFQAFNTVRELDVVNPLDDGVQQGYQRYQIKEDGIAFIRLEPTAESGEVSLHFKFDEHRNQTVRARMKPGARDWIVVGLAEGVLGYNDVAGNMRSLDDAGLEDDLFSDGRIAFYAKGQIKGSWLLTARYDTDKETQEQLRAQIDPNRFYTLYGDGAQQRYDAESGRKLYLKLEREDFSGLFGDFDTGFDDTEFTRYARTLNGLQGVYYGDAWEVSAFASETAQGYFREEIRGDGTSGTYRLGNRDVLGNSERIRIVTRDRFRTEQILDEASLTRYLDYTIDYEAGTLIFKQPVFSQDQGFNPIFIEVEYETRADGAAKDLVAGTRIAYQLDDQDSEVAATYVDDQTAGREGELIGVDLRWDVTPTTRIKAELARTDTRVAGDASAYLVEVEHQGESLAGRAYFREQQSAFGLGQQTALENGTVKLGLEGEYRVTEQLLMRGEAFEQRDDATGGSRLVVSSHGEYRIGSTRLAAGARSVREEVANGEDRDADQLTLGVARSVLDNRLLLRADAELDVSGGDNTDYPSRTILGAEYEIAAGVSLVGEQEFTFGDLRDTQDTRVGVKARPWAGANLNGMVQRQLTENSERVFATTGLLQQLRLNDRWTIDLGVDRVQTLKESGATEEPDELLYNPSLPPASGSLNDDFSAFYTGAGYRHDRWDVSTRIEMHQGDRADKWNYLLGASHQLADGKVMSASVSMLTEETADGSERNQGDARLGIAWRPAGASWLYLNRLDLVFDEFRGNGFDTRTRKLVNNFNANFRPNRSHQLSLQLGLKYVVEDIDSDEYDSITGLYGLEYRHALGAKWDWGARGASLHSFDADLFRYSAGISVGHNLFHNAWVSLGYNFVGFEDNDFVAADYTAEGPYLKLRMKFDQDVLKRFLSFAGWRNQPVADTER